MLLLAVLLGCDPGTTSTGPTMDVLVENCDSGTGIATLALGDGEAVSLLQCNAASGQCGESPPWDRFADGTIHAACTASDADYVRVVVLYP